MDAKMSLLTILKALIEVKTSMAKTLLIDLLTGKESKDIVEQHLDETEAFGTGEEHDEDFWNTILDAATEAGYIKTKGVRTQQISVTPAGKKFVKSPTAFTVNDEEDYNAGSPDDNLEELLTSTLKENQQGLQGLQASPHTKRQIKLIQAIDRKIALDDYAESEGIDLEDVLDDLEEMVAAHKNIDITYFTDEVLGETCVQELAEYFESANTDALDTALEEYGDVYNAEEIRLARIVYRVRKGQHTKGTKTRRK